MVARIEAKPKIIHLAYPSSEKLHLDWTVLKDLGGLVGRPKVFLHLLDNRNVIIRTFDHYLPFAWQPGCQRRYPIEIYQSALVEPLAAGEYKLSIGLHDDEKKQRWALDVGSCEEIRRREYQIAKVEVDDPGESRFKAKFKGGWEKAAENDRQVITRQCLSGSGSIVMDSVSSSGSLVMQISLSETLLGFKGSVKISGTCTSTSVVLRGPLAGPKTVELPCATGHGVDTFEIKLEPSTTSHDKLPKKTRLLCLDSLIWNPFSQETETRPDLK